MNDYYALTYVNLRLAELRAEARRERFAATRPTRVHRGHAIDLSAAPRPARTPANAPVVCCA